MHHVDLTNTVHWDRYKCRATIHYYDHGMRDRICISIFGAPGTDYEGEPMAKCTINIPEQKVDPRGVFIRSRGENDVMLALMDAKIIKHQVRRTFRHQRIEVFECILDDEIKLPERPPAKDEPVINHLHTNSMTESIDEVIKLLSVVAINRLGREGTVKTKLFHDKSNQRIGIQMTRNDDHLAGAIFELNSNHELVKQIDGAGAICSVSEVPDDMEELLKDAEEIQDISGRFNLTKLVGREPE